MDQGNHLNTTGRIPFILITGFLGSGKTSLLIDLVNRYSDQIRMAVVQNEFTPGHADSITLKRTGKPFELLEINNGSVFCACQLGDFIGHLESFLHQAKPDVILLEATGLADPVSLGQIIQAGNLAGKLYLASIWCLADASHFEKITSLVGRTRQQLRMADLIWINKTDLVPATDGIRKQIRALNPFAEIHETTYGHTDPINLITLITHSGHHRIPLPQSNTLPERPDIGSCVVRSNRFFDDQAFDRFIRKQAKDMYRMKGFIRINAEESLMIQTTFGDVNMMRILNYEGPTELIVMGPRLDKSEFHRQFRLMQIQ